MSMYFKIFRIVFICGQFFHALWFPNYSRLEFKIYIPWGEGCWDTEGEGGGASDDHINATPLLLTLIPSIGGFKLRVLTPFNAVSFGKDVMAGIVPHLSTIIAAYFVLGSEQN